MIAESKAELNDTAEKLRAAKSSAEDRLRDVDREKAKANAQVRSCPPSRGRTTVFRSDSDFDPGPWLVIQEDVYCCSAITVE